MTQLADSLDSRVKRTMCGLGWRLADSFDGSMEEHVFFWKEGMSLRNSVSVLKVC